MHGNPLGLTRLHPTRYPRHGYWIWGASKGLRGLGCPGLNCRYHVQPLICSQRPSCQDSSPKSTRESGRQPRLSLVSDGGIASRLFASHNLHSAASDPNQFLSRNETEQITIHLWSPMVAVLNPLLYICRKLLSAFNLDSTCTCTNDHHYHYLCDCD